MEDIEVVGANPESDMKKHDIICINFARHTVQQISIWWEETYHGGTILVV
jgi:hypothetical protein